MIIEQFKIAFKYIQILLIVSSLLTSCGNPKLDQPTFMAFDNIDYIKEFPVKFSLGKKTTPNIDIIGIRSFAIYDSILILNTTKEDGLWSLYSLPNHQYLNSFLKRGEGPLELIQGPSLASKTKITREEGQLVAYLYDFQKGGALKFNIEESINSKILQISKLNTSIPPFLFEFIMIDSSTFFIKEIGNMDTQQIRYLYKNGYRTTLPILDKLNQASILQGEDFNILSALTKLSDIHQKFVEMPIGLNYINLYSLDSTLAKTICIGEKLFDISNIQKENTWDRVYTFSDLRVFDDFFGVVFINEDIKTYQTNRTHFPSILLFNWEGEPLAELKLENHITSFDIDFINNELYTFDVQSDEFYKYDMSTIFPELEIHIKQSIK
ncbi:BF3164 family lipoprotein [Algoriphagus sp. Y33]|uniref:BF3164 family lipoprotein n=1 Tax=Algoriphagus sp. Y33 TaxID=2772483 RepID=UPI0017875096|nr:BF3164 family lipoprotein [Algoriphagus sp. Y33]